MSAIILGHVRSRRGARRALLMVVAVVGGGLLLGYAAFLRLTRIVPPALPAGASTSGELTVHGARVSFGASWVSRERGIWEYHLSGEPFEMGLAHGRLGNRLLMETDDYMFAEFRRYVPSRLARFAIRLGVLFQHRHLTDHIPLRLQQEMLGLSLGYIDRYEDFLPAYHRTVLYHALHDITQTLERSPLIGCTAFAATRAATLSGHLILGRNFDFEGPPIFDRDKAVLFFRPRGRIPFASVAWTGLMGVVTGLNAEGIFVSVNAARTQDRGQEGIPVELLLREVLERARSLQEAIDLLRQHPVLVPDLYLIGDGKTGEAVVVERSPTRLEVRRGGELLPLTNHGLSQPFVADRENERLRRRTTSGARMARLEELLRQHRGAISPAIAVDILRDRKGAGGVPLGLGNRNAIDALIATHSVVADATALILWVGAGPHASGRYIAFDLRRELRGEDRPHPMDLPEDPLLGSEEYRAWELAMQSLRAAEALRRAGELDRAIEEAARAEGLQPKMPEAHLLLGDLLRQRNDPRRGDAERWRHHYRRFLQEHPPYLDDVERVQQLLQAR
ncbi:MAG: C45 family peptidase [Myxococcales bacterium]|nr:C45 family peptidase [Myxococcales bacterium]